MDFLTGLVKQVAAYLLLLAVIKHLLDRSIFGKYINFFTGLLLILIIASPILHFFSMEEQLHMNLSLDFLETDRKELERELAAADEMTAGELEDAYGTAIKEQIGYLLQDCEVEILSCTPVFEKENWLLEGMQIVLRDKDGEGQNAKSSAITIDKIEEIDKIEIQDDDGGKAEEKEKAKEKAGEQTKRWMRKERDIIRILSAYYQIEKEAVELQWRA